MSDFTAKHAATLMEFTTMSNTAGACSDLVQGGGGNTSVKFDDSLMAIKASGFRLAQIAKDNAYAVLDYAAIRRFYADTDPAALDDVEKEGSAVAKAATKTIDGLPQLRPSVEAGFHSILDKFVLHIHPVYANMATCSAEGADVVREALAGMKETHAFVPYINPGAKLTFAIRDARAQVGAATGKPPQIIFMQNHGLILTADSGTECLRLSETVNKRIAAAYGTKFADWPQVGIHDTGAPGEFVSATPWLRSRLMKGGWDQNFFCKQSLYPDQLVFLAGQLGIVEKGRASKKNALPIKATIFKETGEIFYAASEADARTIEETLCAILFITDAIRASRRTLCTMDDAGKDFIANWESEAYRKALAAK